MSKSNSKNNNSVFASNHFIVIIICANVHILFCSLFWTDKMATTTSTSTTKKKQSRRSFESTFFLSYLLCPNSIISLAPNTFVIISHLFCPSPFYY